MMFAQLSRSRALKAAMIAVAFGGALGMAAPVAHSATADPKKSEQHLQKAQGHIKAGQANAAIIELKNAIQKDPGNVAARKLLGEIYLRSGNGPAAEKELKAAQRQGSADAELAVLLGRSYLLQGKFDDVLKDTNATESDDEKMRAEVLQMRGAAQLGLRQVAEAMRSFEEADRLNPQDARSKVGLAQALLTQGKAAEAEAEVDTALKRVPDSSEANVLKAELRRMQKDSDGAIQHFNAAIKANPGNVAALLGRATVLLDLNRDDEAQADIQGVFARVPKHPIASYLSAFALAKKKDYQGAFDALQGAGSALGNHYPSLLLLGAVNYALNNLEQSVDSLSRYVQAVPNNLRARKLLAAALVRKNEAQRAIDVLKPVIEQTPDDAQSLSLMGAAYTQLRKVAEATSYYERAAEAAPETASVRTQLALSHLATGQTDRAIGDLESAVDLDPNASQAGVMLALVKMRQGDFDGALQAAEALKDRMKDSPLPLNLIGAAYLGKGNVAEARKTFEAALKQSPDFHPARMNLAQIELRDGKIDEARAQYETIIKQDPKHVASLLGLADIAANQKKNDEVVSYLQKASDADPRNPTARLRLIGHYTQLGDQQRALSVARQLDQAFPNNARIIETLGRVEAGAKDANASVATFRRLVALAPNSAAALGLLAGSQILAEDMNAARETLRKSITVDDKFVPGYVALAEVEARDNRLDEALKVANQLRDKLPQAPNGDLLAGDLLMRAKKYPDAIAAYQAALKKEDKTTEALRLFNAQREAGQDAVAFSTLQKWADAKNDRPARHVLAAAYIAASRNDDGARESELLLAAEPENPVLLNNLAWIYQQKKDARALSYAEKAYEKAPQVPAIIDTLGWILVENGQIPRGLELLKKANEAAPNQGDIAYHMAFALHKAGQTAQAKGALDKLLSSGVQFSKLNEARALLKELGG